MKTTLKKTVAALFTSAILCAGTASVASAGTVSRNTPHSHGQFTYSRSRTYSKTEVVIPLYLYKTTTYEETTWYCHACDGYVSSSTKVIDTSYSYGRGMLTF